MEWPGFQGFTGYPSPNFNLFPVDADFKEHHYQTPTNPPWALGSESSALSPPLFQGNHDEVAHYPRPPQHGCQSFSECYPLYFHLGQGDPQTTNYSGPHESYPPKPSAPVYPGNPLQNFGANCLTDSRHGQNKTIPNDIFHNWGSEQTGFGGHTPLAGTNPPSSQSETYPYMYPTEPHSCASLLDDLVLSVFSSLPLMNPSSTSSGPKMSYPPAGPSVTTASLPTQSFPTNYSHTYPTAPPSTSSLSPTFYPPPASPSVTTASLLTQSFPTNFSHTYPTAPPSTSSPSPTFYPPPANPSVTTASLLTQSFPTNFSHTYPTAPPSASSHSPTCYPPSNSHSALLPLPSDCTPTVDGNQPPFLPNPHGYAPSPPNPATSRPGLSFSGKLSSSHPLLQGDDEDFVPYEEDGYQNSNDETQNSGYNEDVDYSHETLEKYGENLTTRAKDGRIDPIIGRDNVVKQCIEILARKSKCNPLLVGHPGVGKTAVVEGLALRIVKGDVPDSLRNCKIISVEIGNMLADTTFRGEFEKKIKELLDEATEAKRTVILFFDELHRILGAGKTDGDPTDAAQMLKPALGRGDFLCIGATTYDEYTKYIEKDQALARRFQKVVVDPPSATEAISILRGLKAHFESHHGISIADAALVEAVKLSERYIPDRFLPDKAIDLLDEAAAKIKLETISKPTKLDEIERAIVELDMERLSVSAATSKSSQNRLRQILSDLEGLRAREANLTRKWKKEKAMASRIISLKEKITEKKTRDSAPASVSEDSDDEIHTHVSCDSCEMSPIIGPRFTVPKLNFDLCRDCFKSVQAVGQIEEITLDQFELVKPPTLTCDGCLINPIKGDYFSHMTYSNNVLCQLCWRKLVSSQQQLYLETHNNMKVSKSERANAEGNVSLDYLEAQLTAAENEWNEYQKHYKPLIRVIVTSNEILEVLSSRTGIPVTKMGASQSQHILQLDKELHKRVIGQDEACNAIARAVQRSRAGLSDPKRPIASLMFMGPTGVGKTELAKALASYLFNSDDAMIRIDMSEYGEKQSISRLTGAAPGFVGYEDGGQLTTAVHRRPYSVVLFDEIEKAHNDIFNIFLQILDDGRLTDAQGQVVNFTNTIIIMTSNVGAERIVEVTTNTDTHGSKEEAHQVMKSQVMECVRERYRPEFINRIDEFIVFKPLSLEQICEIVKLQLERVSKRLQDRLINLRVTDSAVQFLSQRGYDPRYGARPVKRVIQTTVEDPLAQGILRGDYTDGSTIMVDTEFRALHPSQEPEQRLTFQKA